MKLILKTAQNLRLTNLPETVLPKDEQNYIFCLAMPEAGFETTILQLNVEYSTTVLLLHAQLSFLVLYANSF
jgi:hypothetical protein